jgi:uridine phosphorylase
MQTQSEEKKVEVEIQINGEDQAHKEELKDEARDKLLHTHQTPAHKSFFVDPKKVGDLSNANFPMDGEGRVYHLGVKAGEVANRILSVGDSGRASLLATFFDDPSKTFTRASTRGFVIHTGRRKGVPMTIIATGMGIPMIDFVVRECRAIVEGPMVIARFGTCGTPQTDIPIGSICVASKGSICATRKYDAFLDSAHKEGTPKALDYYALSKIFPADAKLSELILAKLEKSVRPEIIHRGLNITGDSFYSSQGRVTTHFEDYNESLLDEVLEIHPDVASLEMETFHLFHLAHCSRGSITASAATIVLAQRRSGAFLDHATTRQLEKDGGCAVLDALAEYPLPEGETMSGDCVWNE